VPSAITWARAPAPKAFPGAVYVEHYRWIEKVIHVWRGTRSLHAGSK
jgi:hypothetical protein